MATLYIIVCVLLGLSQACQLPPAVPEIDWTKMMGKTWYVVVTDESPLDKLIGCMERVFEKEFPGGSTGYAFMTNTTGDVERGNTTTIRTPDGYYIEQLGADQTTPEDIMKDLKNINMILLKRQKEIAIAEGKTPKFAFYTDYENYFLTLSCDPSGRKDIWHYQTHRNPDAEEILWLTNKLGEIGNGWDRLHLSLDWCSK